MQKNEKLKQTGKEKTQALWKRYKLQILVMNSTTLLKTIKKSWFAADVFKIYQHLLQVIFKSIFKYSTFTLLFVVPLDYFLLLL